MKRIFKYGLILIAIMLYLSTGFAEEQIQKQLWQTTGNATLRAEPDTQSSVVSYLKQGVVVEELSQTEKWVKVKTPSGKAGWVHKSLLISVKEQDICSNVKGFSALCPVNKEQKEHEQAVEVTAKQKINPLMKVNIEASTTEEPINMNINKIDTKKIAGVKPQGHSETGVEAESAKQEQLPISSSKLLSSNGDLITIDSKTDGFQTSYIVEPETTTAVKMSSSDVNRIVCSVDIKDVVYSEEKGLQVKISGKNAFVKFLIKRIGNKEEYSKIPADIYVVCGEKVYSIIAFPQRQPATTVYLQDKGQKVKEVIDKYASMPVEKRIIELVKAFSKDTPPAEAEFYPAKKQYNLYEGLKIVEKGKYVILGEGLQVRVIDITVSDMPKDSKYIEIAEKDFLRVEITQTPLALSLDKLRLYKGDTARLLVIERSKEEE